MSADHSSRGQQRFDSEYRHSQEGVVSTTLPERASRRWWWQLIYLVVPPRRQRNRPTASGLLLIIIAVGIGVAAYNTASNILFLVLSFVFSLLLVNGILSVLNFRKLDWQLQLPAECRVGEQVKGHLMIFNRKRLYSTQAICFVVKMGDEKPQRVFVRERIGPGDSTSVPFDFICNRRGRENIRVEGPESTYPFGFLRKQTGAYLEREFLVWPAVDTHPSPIPAPRRTSRMSGVQRKIGSGTDLLHLRNYEKGDPLRQIHWKATARTGQLMVRQLADEGSGSFTLQIDCGESLWPRRDDFELLLSRASTLASRLFTQGRLDGYILNRENFRSVRHLSELRELNDELALAERYDGRSSAQVAGGNLIRFVPTESGGVSVELAG